VKTIGLFVVVVNDWFTKKILGAFVGSRRAPVIGSKLSTGQSGRQFPRAIREAENLALNLMSDNGWRAAIFNFDAGMARAWNAASLYRVCQSAA
jgi:hypothetical protein